eukprot:CAMPEP_0115847332 /NCGR_PEP_ID=MMETSP0287-20121206/10327_1 /TAXON_ID=412157 /ORGANISM="Chrysochromulina rotalis, Strain UIO044" /LENGTH=46 /DNA_ID= /DNA_START= /DNA_END= /DNA_ORIENTATION=
MPTSQPRAAAAGDTFFTSAFRKSSHVLTPEKIMQASSSFSAVVTST